MVRQKSSSIPFLVFALAIAGVGCGSGPEDYSDGLGPITGQPPFNTDSGFGTGTLAGTGSTAGTIAGTGATAGTIAGTGATAGTIAGTTAGTTAGGSKPDAGGGATPGGGGTPEAGTDSGAPDASGDSGLRDAGAPTEAGTDAGGGGTDSGTCCPTGDCLCHGDVPAKLGAALGPYKTARLSLSTGTAYYPNDPKATPPFAGLSICPGFTNTGPEMTDWGPFYASWGIVTVVTNTGGLDDPATRGDLLLGSIKALKAENTKSGSPLNGKMSGRYGTSGYSMGGGGTTYASSSDPTLKSSVGLAAWEPIGRNIKVPTLLMCGSADLVAECFHTDQSYDAIPNTTPKMKIVISGAEHLASWFGPDQGGNGTSGGYALAFNKVYLEGDTRWKTLLLTKPQGHEMKTNITP